MQGGEDDASGEGKHFHSVQNKSEWIFGSPAGLRLTGWVNLDLPRAWCVYVDPCM